MFYSETICSFSFCKRKDKNFQCISAVLSLSFCTVRQKRFFHSYSLLKNHLTCVNKVLSNCKNEGIFGKIALNCSKIVFLPIYSVQISISNTFVFQIEAHFSQSKLRFLGISQGFRVLCQFSFW